MAAIITPLLIGINIPLLYRDYLNCLGDARAGGHGAAFPRRKRGTRVKADGQDGAFEINQQARSSRPSLRFSKFPRMVTAIWRGSKKVRAMRSTSSPVTASMLSTRSSREKKWPKYISWRARLDMRLEVDSRPNMSEPLRWSLARRNSS